MSRPPAICEITLHTRFYRWFWRGLIPRRFERVEAQHVSPWPPRRVLSVPFRTWAPYALRNAPSCFAMELQNYP